ncbi:MAG: molybdate ABC transporter substrate-binding protein [Candidatus Bathyarchaeota archaeon]|nr:molybdate ABC transporter substrate-binding protein [Candidatus Bathyarchaeota archaeon]
MNKKHVLMYCCLAAAVFGLSLYAGYADLLAAPSPEDSPTGSSEPESAVELRVFVAASLFNMVEDAREDFEAKHNCKIIFNSCSSNSLYQQILAGSPGDVYLSAHFKWTKQLCESGYLYNDQYYNFTTNTLAVLTPQDNPKNITSLLDLAAPDVNIVIADTAIPVGTYTNTTLTKIDSTWGNQSSPQYRGAEWENYKERFLSNVVSYETTVEAVVGKVALNLGTVDAGMAFMSDAAYAGLSGSQLQVIQVPAEVNTQGTYGLAVIGGTGKPDLASAYVDFWLSSQGQEQLKKFGFGT